MTTEQKKHLNLIGGNLEESAGDLDYLQEWLQSEWDDMSGQQQEDNPDFEQLIIEMEDLSIAIKNGMDKVFERMELC